MANKKQEGTQRKAVPVMWDPENLAYLDEKGKLFERGGRSGRSEAANRIVKLVRDWEAEKNAGGS
jgi:hypothetical protein